MKAILDGKRVTFWPCTCTDGTRKVRHDKRVALLTCRKCRGWAYLRTEARV